MIWIQIVLVTMFLGACSSQESADFKQAQTSLSQGHFRIAATYFDKVVKRNTDSKYKIEAAREAARISFYEIQDYKRAVEYYKFLVLHSSDDKERLESQKQIANIYFNNLQNYHGAIVEYSKLLQMPHTEAEASQYKINIARALYYMGNFMQAESEIDNLLSSSNEESIRFHALMLKGNILVGRKEFNKATEILKGLLSKYPDKASQENVILMLVACYEESLDFKKAIEVLEQYRNLYKSPEYVDLRIKRLKDRIKNAPGAKGFRK